MILEKNYPMIDSFNGIQPRLLDSGYAVSVPPNDWEGTHMSPMYSRLYYITKGDPYVVKDGRRYELEVGKCYLFPMGYSFSYNCDTGMEQLYFHIKLNDQNDSDLLFDCGIHMEYTPPEGFISDIVKYAASDSVLDQLITRNMVCTSLFTMLKKYGVVLKSTSYSRPVRCAMEYIKANLKHSLTIKELSEHAFVSESTLAKHFKSEVGVTVGTYISDAVLFEAEQLLLKTELTAVQISERLGFCDQFYFSRCFKAKYGLRPQKYRKMRSV